jgi:sucrose-6-phosphate hydrolase SacC (GH32 family)
LPASSLFWRQQWRRCWIWSLWVRLRVLFMSAVVTCTILSNSRIWISWVQWRIANPTSAVSWSFCKSILRSISSWSRREKQKKGEMHQLPKTRTRH